MTAALAINFETDLAKSLDAFGARDHWEFAHAATSTNSVRSFGKGFAAFAQDLFMQGDRLANIGQSFVTRLTLADAAGKAWNLGHEKTIFARIQENLSCHVRDCSRDEVDKSKTATLIR
jgi:hypothetical protein